MTENRIRRHIIFFISSISILLAFYFLNGSLSSIAKFSISSAYLSLAFFAGALTIGPVSLLLERANPKSNYLRRDLGIWSAALALLHTLLGLQVHFGGKFWLYFISPSGQSQVVSLRYDIFGLTNYLGLLSTILIAILLLLSNNRSIRKLGLLRWKKWQRCSYLLLFTLPLHGLIYQILEKRVGSYILLLGAITAIAIALQLAGIVKFRRTRH